MGVELRAAEHFVNPLDQSIAHRVLKNFHAESEGVTTDLIVDRLLETVATPKSGM